LQDELGTDLVACAASPDDFWQYVPETDRCASGLIEFRGRTVAAEGSEVQLECLSTVEP
jgi:hypothetical protein